MEETEVTKTPEEEMVETLKEIMELIEADKDMVGGKIVCTSTPTGDRWSYMNRLFIIDAVDPEKYLLSFTINNYRIGKVAMITHVLTLMLYDALAMAEDNFVDINTNTVYYGEEAYLKFAEYVQKKNGVVTCPVCELTCSTEMFIPEKGYCRLCERDVIPYVSFH